MLDSTCPAGRVMSDGSPAFISVAIPFVPINIALFYG